MMRAILSIYLAAAVALAAVALGAACRRDAATPGQAAASEAPTLDVTSWTEQSELYMEHPPLVA